MVLNERDESSKVAESDGPLCEWPGEVKVTWKGLEGRNCGYVPVWSTDWCRELVSSWLGQADGDDRALEDGCHCEEVTATEWSGTEERWPRKLN